MRIKPGQYVMVKTEEGDPLPAEVQQIRYVDTKNGQSAVAVVIEINEMPMPRVLEMTVETGEFTIETADPEPTGGYIQATWFDCPEALQMADPQIVASIQKRLENQREHMRLAIQASLQAPREMSFGGKGSPVSKQKQRDRAKEQRQVAKNTRELAIEAKMAESSCSREEALKFFENMAKARGY